MGAVDFSQVVNAPMSNVPYRSADRRFPPILFFAAALFLIVLLVWFLLSLFTPAAPASDEPTANPGVDIVPEWVNRDLIPINEYSRPGEPLEEITGVVVHYTGNPGTTAMQNRGYFAGLAETGETYASSNFIVGLEGEAILCVPVNEIAYASGKRNSDTLSIEVCHPDSEGAFTPATYATLVRLVQWAVDTYGLHRDQVIRHYDVSGKLCPLYYVNNPDAWEDFLDHLTFPAS